MDELIVGDYYIMDPRVSVAEYEGEVVQLISFLGDMAEVELIKRPGKTRVTGPTRYLLPLPEEEKEIIKLLYG